MHDQPIAAIRVHLPDDVVAVCARDRGRVIALVPIDSRESVARWATQLALTRMGPGSYAAVMSCEVPRLVVRDDALEGV